MIHILDTDPRQFSEPENYKYNHGSLSSVAININNELQRLKLFSEADEAEWVGICDSLNISFKYKNKKSFIISCWEMQNTIPYYLLQQAYLHKPILIGMSNQITKLWNKYGFKCETAHLGVDSDFWHQTKEKNSEKFTFILPLATFSRSAIDLTLEAFFLAFKNNKDVVLKLKDTGYEKKYLDKIEEYKKNGLNIEHFSERWSMQKMRDFYSSAHVCLSLQRAASFGLIIAETMSCNTLNITANIEPFNEFLNNNISVLVNPTKTISILEKTPYLTNEWGLANTYGPFIDCPETPLFYDFNAEEYAEKMLFVYKNYNDYKKISYRDYIKKFSWKETALKIKNILEKHEN